MRRKLTEGEKLAKKLGEMSGSELTPFEYQKYMEQYGYKMEHDTDIAAGCRAVSRGSSMEDYGYLAHKVSKTLGGVALVGKGITFDTGGYSLKSDKHMVGMHMDMMGSALVLGAGIDLRDTENLSTYLCIASNMVSDRSMLPGSEILYKGENKKTIHEVVVNDTDAEGRLVLADGILQARWAKHKVIITVATLTGAIVNALGKNTFGYFTTHDVLDGVVRSAIDNAKEEGTSEIDGWRMPFLEEESLKAMKQGKKLLNYRYGSGVPGASYAASFLKQFVGDVPFIHLDIAGVADKDGLIARVDMVSILKHLVKSINQLDTIK
jgi:leucyl aminopeptidase